MKNKKMVAAIAGAVALILVAVLASQQGTGSNEGVLSGESGIAVESAVVQQTESPVATESPSETGTPAGTESMTDKDENKTETSGADSKKSDEKDNDKTPEAEEKDVPEEVHQSYDSGAVIDDGQNTSSNHSTSSQSVSWKNLENYKDSSSENPEVSPTPKTVDDLSFPYAIPDQDLTVRKIASYDGIFLEDGSDSEVEGVTVIILENTGTQAVEYTEIMFSGNAGQFTFECSDLPSGGVAVVQEKNAAAYREDIHWRRCECAASMLDELEMSEDAVKVTENEDGALLVENISGEDIACVRVFYKFYDEENDAYVGGITYMVKITELAADGQTTVTPSHYVKGYSRVTMVRTYDTAEE